MVQITVNQLMSVFYPFLPFISQKASHVDSWGVAPDVNREHGVLIMLITYSCTDLGWMGEGGRLLNYNFINVINNYKRETINN